MYTIAYHYRVPADAERAFIELQQRVGALYVDAGCLRYAILKPAENGAEWMDLSTFESREAFERAEQKLDGDGRISELFADFLRITRQKQEDIRVSEWHDVIALDAGTRRAKP